ncbi:cytochrome c oxidase subunit 2A [Abyssicoccus albus]|uniref:cytochrome c oxidase subunit 2A n=1 Tax=Abyssicoccus albus TaxID=1817405 RepID=UPI001CEF8D1C|nr:cytochrome c oxidase subunit 2A [Abyssicoccus albus]
MTVEKELSYRNSDVEPHFEENIQHHADLKGTFISVLMLGAIFIILWVIIFILFLSRM